MRAPDTTEHAPMNPLLRPRCTVVLLALAAGAASARPGLNDSGQTRCVDWKTYDTRSDCAGSGQDAAFGWDARQPGDADGRAGLRLEKLDAAGQPLPANASEWSCVRDRRTGLVWEQKTADGGLHDAGRGYTQLGNGAEDDASGLLAATRAQALCGFGDWRLPTRTELEGLLVFDGVEGTQRVDADWFRPTTQHVHWSATSAAVIGGAPVYRWAVNFYGGESFWYSGEFGRFALRLVRSDALAREARWKAEGAEVLDRSTGLRWMRCPLGMGWDGSRCTGTATTHLSARDAVQAAKAVARESGLPWRLPNPKELSTLVDTGRKYPALNPQAFPGVPSLQLYSGTHWPDNPVYFWRLNTAVGLTERDFWGGAVQLVRDEPR